MVYSWIKGKGLANLSRISLLDVNIQEERAAVGILSKHCQLPHLTQKKSFPSF